MKKVLIFLLLITLLSCGKSEIKTKNREYLSLIAEKPGDIDLNRDYLNFLFIEASYIDEAINYYELNRELFANDSVSLCIYGAALCAKGGIEKKIEDKLLFLKRGMIILDRSIGDATDYNPYLWRIQTYSHFPEVMNVRSIVETDIETVIEQYTLPPGALYQVYSAQLNVAKEYKDSKLLENILKLVNETLPTDFQKSLFEKIEIIRKDLGV